MTNSLTEQVLELFTLNEKQRLAATETNRDVVVTAGAGSGKTSTLVARYACLLAQGINPRSIAAITFTVKAAQEMRSRVRSKLMELEENAANTEERSFWVSLASQMDSARIGTIHSLCAEIVRNHPAEVGIDPRFDMIDQNLADALKLQIVEDEMARMVEEERFLPLLMNMPVKDLSRLLGQMLDRRLDTAETFNLPVDSQARLQKVFCERVHHDEIQKNIAYLRSMGKDELIEEAGGKLAEMVQNLLACWTSAEESLEAGDIINSAIHLFNARRNYLKLNVGKRDGSVRPIIKGLQNLFDTYVDPLTGGKNSQDKPPSPESEEWYLALTPLLAMVFNRVHDAYRQQLDARNALDFDDLECYAQQLLGRPDIRDRWRDEIEMVMVDEYQDTNPRQREIVNAIAGNRGCLFIVGDMRQSIYKFRRADVTVFREEQVRIKEQNGLLINLDMTYRTHKELLDGMGDLLSDVIGTEEDPSRDYYIPFTALRAFKQEPEHPVKLPHLEFVVGLGENAENGKELSGHALATRLLELKNERQIRSWDEVTLLFRATTGYPYYEEALEEAGIPFVSVAGKGFYDRPEIRDLLNILGALADPYDDLAFAGLLRSPAFGLSDAALFLLKQHGLPYWQALQTELECLAPQDKASAERALLILNAIIPLVDRVPVAELLKRLIDELDYRALMATADIISEQSQSSHAAGRLWRNVDKLLADTQLSKAVNVREYLDLLNTVNDAGAREGEASADAQGSVRLMTIHAAKGLEFPVLVLADAGRGKPSSKSNLYLSDELGVTFKLDPPPMLFNLAKHLDDDQEGCEDYRLQYVAMTRAQAKLIICSNATFGKQGNVSVPGWAKAYDEALGHPSVECLTKLNQAFISETTNRYPVRTIFVTAAPQTQAHKQASLVHCMPVQSGQTALYKPVEGFGEIEQTDDSERGQTIQSWRATHIDSQIAGNILGVIVHKALQRWLFPGDSALDALLEAEALWAGLATEINRHEIAARARTLLTRFREHSHWDEINETQERYSELPYSYLINDKPENRIIDLLYRNESGWQIIDFKTDSIHSYEQKELLLQRYAVQVRRYKAIIQSKLSSAVKARICFLDDRGKVSVVEV